MKYNNITQNIRLYVYTQLKCTSCRIITAITKYRILNITAPRLLNTYIITIGLKKNKKKKDQSSFLGRRVLCIRAS